MEIWGVYTVSYENIRSTRSKNTNYIVFLHCGIYYQCSIWNPFGVISAVNRGKPLDTVVTLIANVTACLPQFWFALLIMFVFAMKLGWLPSYGFDWPWINAAGWKQMIMPLFCLSWRYCFYYKTDTIQYAGSDPAGLHTYSTKQRYCKQQSYLSSCFKNALIPVITILGMRLGNLIAGSMFVESVFNIPGMGSLMVKAIQSRDIPVVQACVLAIALVSCIVNLATDILYAVVDPRVRFE